MKKYIVIAVLLLCLTGCGSNQNELLKSYKNCDDGFLLCSDFENELKRLGYEGVGPCETGFTLNSQRYMNQDNDSFIERGLSNYGNKLLEAYRKKVFSNIEYGFSLEDAQYNYTYVFGFWEMGKKYSPDQIKLFSKELKGQGLHNIYESVQKASEKGEKAYIVVIQDGVHVYADLSQNRSRVVLQNYEFENNGPYFWKRYFDHNLKESFWEKEATTGGLMDRLSVYGGKNEAGCKYQKEIQIYKKDNDIARIEFYFDKNNLAGAATFLPKEKQSVIKILKTMGISETSATRFVESYDPEQCKDTTLDGIKFCAVKEAGRYKLSITSKTA